jgi:phosphonate transport system substrate-binding protein
MLEDGRLERDALRIIWETPPYPNYVWSVQAGFDDATQARIRNAFLSLTPDIRQHAAILARLDAGGFLPASISDFEPIVEVTNAIKPLTKN